MTVRSSLIRCMPWRGAELLDRSRPLQQTTRTAHTHMHIWLMNRIYHACTVYTHQQPRVTVWLCVRIYDAPWRAVPVWYCKKWRGNLITLSRRNDQGLQVVFVAYPIDGIGSFPSLARGSEASYLHVLLDRDEACIDDRWRWREEFLELSPWCVCGSINLKMNGGARWWHEWCTGKIVRRGNTEETSPAVRPSILPAGRPAAALSTKYRLIISNDYMTDPSSSLAIGA
jgi:hypothetical protein